MRFIAMELNDLFNTTDIFYEDIEVYQEEISTFMNVIYAFYETLPENFRKVFFGLFYNLVETDFHFYETGDASIEIQPVDHPNDLQEYLENYRQRMQKYYQKFGIFIMNGFDF